MEVTGADLSKLKASSYSCGPMPITGRTISDLAGAFAGKIPVPAPAIGLILCGYAARVTQSHIQL
jgi:hypothetical protein